MGHWFVPHQQPRYLPCRGNIVECLPYRGSKPKRFFNRSNMSIYAVHVMQARLSKKFYFDIYTPI
jgi:hypothetical protein